MYSITYSINHNKNNSLNPDSAMKIICQIVNNLLFCEQMSNFMIFFWQKCYISTSTLFIIEKIFLNRVFLLLEKLDYSLKNVYKALSIIYYKLFNHIISWFSCVFAFIISSTVFYLIASHYINLRFFLVIQFF